MLQTLDQRYADTVRKQVLAVQNTPNDKKYGAMSHKLPILIHTAGLLQALEFVNSRKEEIFKRLLEDLALTLGRADRGDLLEKVRDAGLREYILLTQETLAALLWYKRFAQSILNVEASEEANEGK